MQFSILRDLFAYSILLSSLFLLSKIGIFSNTVQQGIIILLPMLFIAFHVAIKRKFKQDLDNQAYFSAIFGVAVFAALGSFSQTELIELGFKAQAIISFALFKIYFHTWAIVLLPIALKKFFKKD